MGASPFLGIVRQFAWVACADVTGCDVVLREVALHELVHVALHDHVGVQRDQTLSHAISTWHQHI